MPVCPKCGESGYGVFCGKCGERFTDTDERRTGVYSSNNKTAPGSSVRGTADAYEYREKKRTRLLRDVLISVSVMIVLIVVGLFAFRMYVSNKKEEVNTAVKLAETSFKENNYELALRQLSDVKSNKYYNENKQALLIEGKSNMELKKYDEAVDCFEKALEIENDDEAILNLAVCYARLGQSEKALDTIEKTEEKTDAKAYIEGEIYSRENKFDLAEESFIKVKENTKDEGLKRNAYISLANLYKERRHEDKDNFTYLNKQIEIMEEAVRELKAEDDLVLTEMLGEAYFTAKYYDLALNKFNRLLELGYERTHIYVNIAIIHQQTGNLKEAENVLLDMRDKYPEEYTCYEQLAFVYLDMESEKQQNKRDYSKVVKNYELAKKYVDSQNESKLLPLENAIEELREKGWI